MNDSKSLKHLVIKWMRAFALYSNGINATQLAEAACDHFNEASWLEDETHWIWDEAVNTLECLENVQHTDN